MPKLEFAFEREAKRQENKREDADHDVPSGWREPTIWLRTLAGYVFWGTVVLGAVAIVMAIAEPIEVFSFLPWPAAGWFVAYLLDRSVALLVGD